MRKVSGLIIGLGLLLSLVAAANTITTLRSTAPPPAIPTVAVVSRQKVVVAPILWPTPPPVIEAEPGAAPELLPINAPVVAVYPDPVSVAPDPAESPSNEAAAQVWLPERIVIPAIQLDAPVVAVGFEEVQYEQKTYRQWEVPERFAAGWHQTTAALGAPGNTVLNGHHNFHGQVFAHLADLEVGDRIVVYSGETAFAYVIALKMILPERDQPVSVRAKNAQWIGPSQDERLTLVTCWPYYSNTHRVIVVATPIGLADRGSLE